MAGVCWCSMTSVKLSADSVDEEKKSPVKAGNDSFWKWSWLTGPSIHGAKQKSRRCFPKEATILSKRSDGAKQKNRRCFLKESTMLRGSSQYTLRYQLTTMPWEVVIRDKNPVYFYWAQIMILILVLITKQRYKFESNSQHGDWLVTDYAFRQHRVGEESANFLCPPNR